MQKIGKLIGMLLIAVVFVVIPLYGCETMLKQSPITT